MADSDAKNKIIELLAQAEKQFKLLNAIKSWKLDAVKAAISPELLQSNIQSFTVNPLFAAIRAGNVDIVKYIVAEGLKVDNNFVKQKIKFGTPLIAAVMRGDFEIGKFLLESGAEPNIYVISPKIVRIPIFEALAYDDAPKWVELLKKYEADIDYQMPRDNITPLIFAARDCRLAVAKKLLEVGANPLLKDSNGQTAGDAARKWCQTSKGYDEFIALLQEKEAIFTKAKPTIPVSQSLISALQDLTQKLVTLSEMLPKN